MGIAYNQRTHRCGELRAADAGKKVLLAGWVHATRDHGAFNFVDIRDHTGLTQLRFNPDVNRDAHAASRKLHHEDVVAVVGNVLSRGANVNTRIPTGEIEVEVTEFELLSTADPLPFQLDEAEQTDEDLRLKYRFLDFRRPQVQRALRMRHRIAKAIRDYFAENGFVEIETPFLTKSTPEGARDYLVPSRIQHGSFYALPQSPQIFKQLCMIGGFDRYAQIVRCFRDEDLRADRQPEFTQLDMEMAFVTRDEVMAMVEGCVQRIFQAALDISVKLPFPRLSFEEAVRRYGHDAPDTRYGMELQNITELAKGTEFSVFREAIAQGGVVKCVVAKKAEALTRKVLDTLTEDIKGIGAAGLPYTKVQAGAGGLEFATGIAKFMQPIAAPLCAAVRAEPGDVIFFMPGTAKAVAKYLHNVRTRVANLLGIIPKDTWNLLWVVDFPMFDYDEEEKRWVSMHHPFTSPLPEDIGLLESDPGKARAQAYDLVLNGSEIAGGSIRIHRRDVQSKVFGLLGISEAEAQQKFEFLMEALRFGAPPHGGIAYGLDRIAMLLSGSESLRDVIAFPKNTRAVCFLTGAPTEVAPAQLEELALSIKTKKPGA